MHLRRGRSRHQNGWIELTATHKWKAHWYEYRKDAESGKEQRIHRSRIVGAKSELRKYQAEELLAKLIAPVNAGGSSIDNRVTLEWFWTNRFKPMRETSWAAATKRGCETDWNRYVKPVLGDVQLKDIGMFQCQQALNGMAKFSLSVVKRTRVMMSSILGAAVDLEFIAKNPAKKLALPICKPTPKPTLKPEVLAMLLDAVTDIRDHLILSLGCFGALTSSELFGLVWGCYKGEQVEIRSIAYQGKLQVGRVKRESRHREVYLPAPVRLEMEKWRKITPHGTGDGDLIFPNTRKTRGPMWPGIWLQKHIAPLAEKLGIKVPVTFQVLRRSAATRNQKRAKDLQAHLGHSSIQTTMNVYAQEVPESIREMVADDYTAVMGTRPKVIQ